MFTCILVRLGKKEKKNILKNLQQPNHEKYNVKNIDSLQKF